MINGFYFTLFKKIKSPYSLIMNPFRDRRERSAKLHEKIMSLNNPPKISDLKDFFYSVPFRFKNCFFWDSFFNCLESKKSSKEFLLAISNTSSRVLSSGEWIELSMWLLSFGFFKESILAREKSYQSILSIKEKIVYNLYYHQLHIQALVDQGSWEEAKAIVHRNKRFRKVSVYEKAFLLEDKSVGFSLDKEYFSLINGKKIAVIGPLTFDQDYRNEIESADVIVELNAVNYTRDTIKAKYHGKPDIIYYNNFRNTMNSRNNFNDVPKDVKYIVIKMDKYKKELSKISNCRVIPSTSTWTWNGSFSMMETVLADLLLFNPSKIIVYGVDLYTSINYDKSYSNKPAGAQGITFNFTVHDIFTQFLFMKSLYVKGLISADRRLSKVLSLSIQEYSEVLENNYPIYFGEDVNKKTFEKNYLG